MRRGGMRLRRDIDLDRFGISLLVWDRPRGFGSRDHGFRATVGRGTPPMGPRVSGVAGEARRIPAFGETISAGVEGHRLRTKGSNVCPSHVPLAGALHHRPV